MRLLAHQGGWDEVLLPAILLLLFLGLASARRGRRSGSHRAASPDCLYCGKRFEAGESRCRECGLRRR